MTWLTVLFVVIAVLLGTFALGGVLAAPWVPLWKRDVRRMLRLAKVQPGEKVYDLGAGDGRVVLVAAREFGARGVGFEIAVLPYLLGRGILALSRHGRNAQLRYANFYTQSLGDADVVTTFLSTRAMESLRPKFEQELKPGARVVSYVFSIPGWEPTQVDKPDASTASIYVYQR